MTGDRLPEGWRRVQVSSVMRLVNGCAFKPSDWTGVGLPIVRIQNLNNPDAPFNRYSGEKPRKFLIDDGALLFAWSGTPGTSFGAHIWRGGKAWLNQHIFHVIFDERDAEKRFLQLTINRNLGEYVSAAHGGAGLAHITKGVFERSFVLLPPLAEQRRIVEKIEELFSQLDAGVAALERVRANLKRYRASVLKAAVEGRLTEEWRRAHPDAEQAAELLKRIRKERREAWEREQLASFEKKGKQPPKNWREKYKEPEPPDTTDLPELPEGWCWARLGEVCTVLSGYGFPRELQGRACGAVPFFKVGDISAAWRAGQRVLREAEHYITESEAQGLGARVLPAGTVVFAKIGAAIALNRRAMLGQGSLVDNNVMGLAPGASVDPVYLYYYMCTQRLGELTRGGVVPSLRRSDVSPLVLPLPPLSEQAAIVAEVEARLSVLDALEAMVEANLARAGRLRQAILKRAFEGRLVPQECGTEEGRG